MQTNSQDKQSDIVDDVFSVAPWPSGRDSRPAAGPGLPHDGIRNAFDPASRTPQRKLHMQTVRLRVPFRKLYGESALLSLHTGVKAAACETRNAKIHSEGHGTSLC